MNKNTIRAELAALCRLALRGLDTLPNATPEIKALKQKVRGEIARLMRRVVTMPEERLTAPRGSYHKYCGVFKRNSSGNYDYEAGARVLEITWLIFTIELGLGYTDEDEHSLAAIDLKVAFDELDFPD